MSAIISNSFTTAGSAMVGQNLGAKKYERVPEILKTVAIFSFAITGVLCAVMLIFPKQVYGAFTSDAAVLAVAGILTAPIVLNFIGSATRSISFSIINGSGNTKLNFAVAIIDGIISRIGISALLGFTFGMECLGFWYGDSIAGFVPIIIGMSFYLSGKWKQRRD